MYFFVSMSYARLPSVADDLGAALPDAVVVERVDQQLGRAVEHPLGRQVWALLDDLVHLAALVDRLAVDDHVHVVVDEGLARQDGRELLPHAELRRHGHVVLHQRLLDQRDAPTRLLLVQRGGAKLAVLDELNELLAVARHLGRAAAPLVDDVEVAARAHRRLDDDEALGAAEADDLLDDRLRHESVEELLQEAAHTLGLDFAVVDALLGRIGGRRSGQGDDVHCSWSRAGQQRRRKREGGGWQCRKKTMYKTPRDKWR
jgi:hypothetical protein